ncbi:L,D-transpeptidase [Companilactobacillus kimchiensis]|uniref:L,D-TPase catalytic domain-containing protein n=1 Tax=Companilactobacillus kimchiensis TaxID=993692 RepID=A0A0R2LMU4_9LACO|nr:L,D-transpeptidase [Companilactobacillus kimchiensis]KRO00786.1 hypothetical protein IV57_GL000106 [Companilactobacillus kimchiensis]
MLGLGSAAFYAINNNGNVKVEADSKTNTKTTASAKSTKSIAKKADTPKTVQDDKDMVGLKNFKYDSPSEKKAYPDLQAHPNAWIDVDIATQRVYIMDGTTKLYSMYSSTGRHDTTPRGTYYIQHERGDFFYTEPLKMGAYYWVSFLNHGEYLFHTTPTDINGKYDETIGKTLGREPSSHGCVHLSVPDCKWVYDNVPSDMKVVIHGKYQG